MATLQEIGARLMKPAKDLADWNFPLAEILEEYYSLLQNPMNVNFGEAALVLQNSANVYARRVEYLRDETEALNHTFINESNAEEVENSSVKVKGGRKVRSVIDFNDFEPVKLVREMGKNVNIKDRRGGKKHVKLLTPRFTQLESNVSQLSTPIEILSTNGEVIGNKYDFRCNQQLTRTCMLVDELTPNDFVTFTPEESDQNAANQLTNTNAMHTNDSETSDYCLDNTLRECNDNMEATSDENLDMSVETENGAFSSNQESGFGSMIDCQELYDNRTAPGNLSLIAEEDGAESAFENDFNDRETEEECRENLASTVAPRGEDHEEVTGSGLEQNESATSTVALCGQNDEGLGERGSERDGNGEQNENVVSTVAPCEENDEGVGESGSELNQNGGERLKASEKHLASTVPSCGESVEEVRERELEQNENRRKRLGILAEESQDDRQSPRGESEVLRTVESDKSAVRDQRRKKQKQCAADNVSCQSPAKSKDNHEKRKGGNNNGVSDEENTAPEVDAGYTSGDAEEEEEEEKEEEEEGSVPEKRRSKRMKNSISAVDDIDKKVWEPIPFEFGIPDKLPRRRSEFKLPCHISLLRTKSESRKRKFLSNSKKQECLTRFFLNEFGTSHKMSMYSPTRQLFAPLKEEDVEEFQKTFDECFKSMRGFDIFHYQAVTSVTMDLLGFQPNFAKRDPLVDPLAYAVDHPIVDPAAIIASEAPLSPPPNAFTPPATPEPSTPDRNYERLAEPSTPDRNYDECAEPSSPVRNYEQLVERRVREICEESDVQTELECRVREWHRSLKPKLVEAERRQNFEIHSYGSRILESLQEAKEQMETFDGVVQQQPANEVARYFLASLQLANTYNIDIKVSGEIVPNIELVLLNTERHHEALDTFQTLSASSSRHTSKVGNSDALCNERLGRSPLCEVSNDCNNQTTTTGISSYQKKRKHQ